MPGIDWQHLFGIEKSLLELVIREGRVLEGNMRREMLTREELLSKLREHGIDGPDEVRWAYMESDGKVSVARREGRA